MSSIITITSSEIDFGASANIKVPATETLGLGSVAVPGIISIATAAAGNVTLSRQLDMGTNKIINVVDPESAQEAATKNYVDTHPVTAAGANTQVQFNNSNALGADSGLTYTGTGATGVITVGTGVDITINTIRTNATVANANLNLSANGTGKVTVPSGDQLNIADNTTSTSTSTGCLTTTGGVGIGEKLWVAGTANVAGIATLSNGTNSTSITTGGAVVSGGLGVGLALFVGGLANVAGIATLANLTDSTSITTGGTVVLGGLGVSKTLYVGTGMNVAGTSTIATANISGVITGTLVTESTSTGTGAVILSGGLGMAKNLFSGGSGSFAATTASVSTSTGSLVTGGGLGVAGAINAAGRLGVGAVPASTMAMIKSSATDSVLELDTAPTATTDQINFRMVQRDVSTAAAATTTVYTQTINASSVYLIEVRMICRITGVADGGGGAWITNGVFTSDNTGTPVVTDRGGQNQVIFRSDSTWNVLLTVDTNSVKVQVVSTAVGLKWQGTISVQNFSA